MFEAIIKRATAQAQIPQAPEFQLSALDGAAA
jgi:hypothetical protein